MSEPIHSEIGKGHFSLRVLPSIITRHQDDIVDYAETLSFISFLFMVFFLPLFETWKNVGFGLALFFWLAWMCVSRDFRVKLYPAGWGHLVFMGAASLSALFAINHFQGLRGVWDIFRYFAVYLLVVNTFKSEKQIRLCIVVLLVSISIGCLWGYTEYYFNPKGLWYKYMEIHSLGHANHTATYLAIVLSLCGGLLVTDFRLRRYNFFLSAVMVIVGVALLMTRSRSALIALAIVYCAFIFLMRSWRAKIFLGAFILFLALLALVYPIVQPEWRAIQHEWKTMLHPRDAFTLLINRTQIYSKTLPVIRDHPFFGVGSRNFNFIDHEKYNLVGVDHAHSLYVNAAAELGIVGLSALLGWLASCWVTLNRIRKHRLSNDQYGYWLAAVGALLIIMVSGIVTTTLHTEGAIAFSLVLGISVAATRTK